MTARLLSVAVVAARLSVRPERVRDWIAGGELPAVDVRRSGAKRATWSIREDDIAAFIERRSTSAARPVVNRRRQQPATSYIR